MVSVADVLVVMGSLAILAGVYREMKKAEQSEPERIPVPVPVRSDEKKEEPRE